MAYHPYVPESDLAPQDTLAAAPVDDLEATQPQFAPIVTVGAGDDTLTLADEGLAPVETVTPLEEVTPDADTAPVVDLGITDPTPPVTDATLIPVDLVTLTPTEASLPVTDGTDYVD